MSKYHGSIILERQNASTLPALPPPPGVTPDFYHHSSLWTWALVVLSIQMAIAVPAILIRVFARLYTQRSLSKEDYLIIFAQLCQIGESLIIPLKKNIHNYANHQWNLTLAQYLAGLKDLYVIDILYSVTILPIKLAILFQFLRLFAPNRRHNPYMWYECWTLIVCNFIFYVTITGASIGFCTPIPRFWNREIPGHCLNYPLVYKVSGIINVVSDCAIILLPLPSLYRLNMPTKKKLDIVSVFGTGIFALAASILRTYYIWLTFGPGADMTWNITVVQFCYWAESAMGILAFCLPVFPQFFRILREKTLQSQKSKDAENNNRSPTPPLSSSDEEMTFRQRDQVTVTRVPTAPYMDVSLASFEVNRPSSYVSKLDPHREFHAITTDVNKDGSWNAPRG